MTVGPGDIEQLDKAALPRRKRVLTALDHRAADRIPIDFGGTPVTGIHVSDDDFERSAYRCDDSQRHHRKPQRPVAVMFGRGVVGLWTTRPRS